MPVTTDAIPAIGDMTLVLLLCGVVSSGLTEVIKLMGRKLWSSPEQDPAWWQGLFRLIPICIGGAMGNYFFLFPWGVSVGASGGVLSVVIYKRAREFVESMKKPS